MEALNAVGLSPFSLLPKRTQPITRSSSTPKLQSFPNSGNPNPNGALFSTSRNLKTGLVFLSSLLSSELAKALTLDESQDIDISGVLDSVIRFASENPIIVGGGAAVVAVPVVVAQLFSQNRAWGVESAKNAYVKLGDDSDAQLVDIRTVAEIKEVGSPDVRGFKKKAVNIVYKGEDKPGFLKKLSLKFKQPEKTTLFILDKFDGNSELVAELVTSNGFKAAYAIKDGAEGSKGWKNSGLPWIPPSKSVIDLSGFTDALGEASDAAPVALGIAAAAAGLGILAFAEVETVLQVLGSAALIQFVSKKLLFAEDRKQTIQQIEELLNTKVAPKELVGDIGEIGKALLPPVSTKALPAPADTTPAPADVTVQKSEAIPETITPAADVTVQKSEAIPETITPEINSAPKAEVEESSLPAPSRPLSPYPNYPDFKPPSSPIPSQP